MPTGLRSRGTRLIALTAVVVLLATLATSAEMPSLPSQPTTASRAPSPSSIALAVSRSDYSVSTQSAIGTAHAILHHPSGGSPAGIDPVSLYTSEPAPMGESDMGVGADLVPYSYSTSEIMTNVSWTSQNIYNDSLGKAAEDLYSFQLNAFVNFSEGGSTYTFWIQDVATMDTKTLELQFMDCVWNATTASAEVATSGTLSGNGSVSGGVYSWDSTTAPGGTITTGTAASYRMIIESARSSTGLPVVYLGYMDSATAPYYQDFDTVTFTFAKHVTSDANFVVSGYSYDVWGTAYDMEIMVGGPYNGDFTIAHPTTDISFQLYRWNGRNFESPPATWNFGSETAESISSAQTFSSNDGAGTPEDVVWNGTAHNATTGALYNQYQVGTLSISAPSIASGTVAVDTDQTPFLHGGAFLVLRPGTYHVWLNSSSGSNDLGLCTVTPHVNTTVSVPGTCSGGSSGPTISSFTLTPNPVKVNNSETLSITASGGTAPLTYSYWGLPTGCTSTNSATLTCTPSVPGTYPIYGNVTDAKSLTASYLQTLVVSAVPSPLKITLFHAVPQNVSVVWATTFQVFTSGGTSPLYYSYTNMPPGCSPVYLSTMSSANCVPTASGHYNATVEVTDSSTPSAQHAWANASVWVEPAPPPLEITSFGAVPNPVVVDHTTTINVTTSGGDGWPAAVYTGLPAPWGCGSLLLQFSCTPTTTGTFLIQVNASISASSYANKEFNLTVLAPLQISSFTVNESTSYLGQSLAFSAWGVGGEKPYIYSYWANRTGCSFGSSGNNTCIPQATGNYSVVVVLTDERGSSTHAEVSLDVRALPGSSAGGGGGSSPASGFLGLSNIEWLVIAVVLAAVALVGAAFALRRKSAPPPEMVPVWPPPEQAPPSYGQG